MGIAQVLVAVGLMIIILMANLDSLTSASRAQKNVHTNIEFSILTNQIFSTLSSELQCPTAMKITGDNPIAIDKTHLPRTDTPSTHIPIVKLLLGSNPATASRVVDMTEDQETLNRAYVIEKFAIINAFSDGTATIAGVTYDRFIGSVLLQAKKRKNQAGNDWILKQEFPLVAFANTATGVIVHCFAKTTGSDLRNVSCPPSGNPSMRNVITGFDSSANPICRPVMAGNVMCSCCPGALPNSLPASMAKKDIGGCGSAGCYWAWNCRYTRTDNGNYTEATPINWIIDPANRGLKGSGCTLNTNDSSHSGLYVADCDDGTGMNSTTFVWTDL